MKGKIKINQEVLLQAVDYRRNGKEARKGIITRIGRKYFDVCKVSEDGKVFGSPILFEIKNGREKDTGLGYGRDWILYLTEQERADDLEREYLGIAIRRRFMDYDGNTLSLEKLREIAAIVGIHGISKQEE